MTPATSFAGRIVAVFGLGGSGMSAARALEAGGATVLCWDDGEASREKAAQQGLTLADLRAVDWSRIAALVLAPGVPLTHEKGEAKPHWSAAMATSAGVPILGDIELFFRERARVAPGAPVIAITGTNGKSTTTALVAHLLKVSGREVAMGGNIGANILDLAPPAPARVHVIEMSSFQIDLTPSLAPTVGIQLNLTPDHLDRHGTMEAYAAIKECLIASADQAVVGVDDVWSRAMADRRAAAGRPLTRIAVATRLPTGLVARGTRLIRMEGGEEFPIADLDGIASLRGAHNAQNAAAATAAVLALGVSAESIQSGLRSYASLPHRMEAVGRVGRVAFINDSKATNADSTRGALSGAEGLFWIVGGKAKEEGIEPLRPLFPAVAKAYLIGDASERFAATLEGAVAYERCGTLDIAVQRAAKDAIESPFARPVVLLSPACASHDQFRNFEERGALFRTLVQSHPDFSPAEGGS